MRSKSFDTQEGGERDRPEGSRRVERLSHLLDGNKGRCLPDGRKGMQNPGEFENVKKKIYARTSQMLWHGIGNFVWASSSGEGKVGEQKDE